MSISFQPYDAKCKTCHQTIVMRYSRKKEKYYPSNPGKTPGDPDFFHNCLDPTPADKLVEDKKEFKAICPLLYQITLDPYYCMKEDCQWWVTTDSDCVIKCLCKH